MDAWSAYCEPKTSANEDFGKRCAIAQAELRLV
jgi:hypothetical protein